MRENKKPVIESLLDLDFYKLTMAQVAWRHFRNIPVKYAFKNRTQRVALADYVKEEDLRRQLDFAKSLKFTLEEIDFLRESQYIPQGLFKEDFLDFLKELRLSDFYLAQDGRNLLIEISGFWPEAILWETIVLSIVNELYYSELRQRRSVVEEEDFANGKRRLLTKIAVLKRNQGIKFSDFGTRRRYSRKWHQEALKMLVCDRALSEKFIGTSNVFLAKELGLRPIGTFAHEMYMIMSGIFHSSDKEIRLSHNKTFELWWQEYGEPLSIALTDNYGTDFFFRDFTLRQAAAWKGLRHDSGDPIKFGEQAIAFYERLGINPKIKTLVFSDGLDVNAMDAIYCRFKDRINVVFGWGTNLTNDVGYEPLSLVVKAVESCGHGLVKLSDNIAKAIGKPEDIEKFKRIFGYTNTLNKPCVY